MLRGKKKKLPEGKIPVDVLRLILESVPRGELLAPATRLGMDAAIIKTRGKYVAVVSGSSRGVEKSVASKLVIELAEKIKYTGAKPRVVNPIVLFPKGVSSSEARGIVSEIAGAASKLGLTVAKGHTEITPWLDRTTILLTVLGTSKELPRGVKPAATVSRNARR